MKPALLSCGNGTFGTSFFKNRQTGSHPSFTFQIRSLSFGTRNLTEYLINIIYYKSLKNSDLERLGLPEHINYAFDIFAWAYFCCFSRFQQLNDCPTNSMFQHQTFRCTIVVLQTSIYRGWELSYSLKSKHHLYFSPESPRLLNAWPYDVKNPPCDRLISSFIFSWNYS